MKKLGRRWGRDIYMTCTSHPRIFSNPLSFWVKMIFSSDDINLKSPKVKEKDAGATASFLMIVKRILGLFPLSSLET